jgi:hypothetical protein
MDNDYIPYKTIQLEKLQIGCEFRISKKVDANYFDDMVAYRIKGYVWSQDAGKKVEFKYPADWWQAFKERWFKGWFLKNYPVKYTHKEFQVKATYPDLIVQSHEPIMRLIETTYTDDFYNYLTKNR